MNEKQLTNDQIKELHKLVERNAIKYYDVEVEIVDHYASAIEEIWTKDPSIHYIIKLKNKGSKKGEFLVLNTLLGTQMSFNILQGFFSGFVYSDPSMFPNWFYILLSVMTVLAILVSVGHYKVARSIFEEWKTQYPQFV